MKLFTLFLLLSTFQPYAQAAKTPETIGECNAMKSSKEADEGIQPAMNEDAGKKQNCVRHVLNKHLDAWIVPLKKTNPALYSNEMQVQKQFNQAVDTFTKYFSSRCNGSACGMCYPEQNFNEYRDKQALTLPQKKLKIRKVKKQKTLAVKIANDYFGTFIDSLCQEKGVWEGKDHAAPAKCTELATTEVASVLEVFTYNEDAEDVCSQIGQPAE